MLRNCHHTSDGSCGLLRMRGVVSALTLAEQHCTPSLLSALEGESLLLPAKQAARLSRKPRDHPILTSYTVLTRIPQAQGYASQH
eukprot:135805-Amphidinium_carterae.1